MLTAQEAVRHAKDYGNDYVIIDTAGRLGVDEVLMQQARDIRDAVQPNEILFVIDAMIGQMPCRRPRRSTRRGFHRRGAVQARWRRRGGAALSVASVTGKPILFASTGEGLKDFEVFHPDRMASRILDMGDILTLIEQAQKQFDEEEARKAAVKISDGSFGLDDFLDQLQQVRKLGPMRTCWHDSGQAAHRKELEQFDEREIDRTEAIIRSMTPAERRDPSIIDGSRRARIGLRFRRDGFAGQRAAAALRPGREDDAPHEQQGRRRRARLRRPRDGRRQRQGQRQEEQEEVGQVRQSDEARGRGEGVARQARRQGSGSGKSGGSAS